MVVLSDDYVLHFDYFILEFLNVTILIDSVDNERTAEPHRTYVSSRTNLNRISYPPLSIIFG